MALSVAAVGSALAVAAQLNRNSAAPRSSDVRSNHAALDDGAANVDAGLNDSGAVFASDKAEGDASGQSKARCAPTALVALTEDRNTLEHRQPTTFGGLGENRLRTCLAAQGIRLLDTESGPEVEAARLCEEAARLGGDYLVCGAIEATPTEMASVDIEGLIGRNWIVRLRVAVYSTRPRSKLLFTHTADPVHAVLLGSESCNDDSIARIANSACAEIAARLMRDWRDRRN